MEKSSKLNRISWITTIAFLLTLAAFIIPYAICSMQ